MERTTRGALGALLIWLTLALGACQTPSPAPGAASVTPLAGAFAAAPPTGGVVVEAWIGTPQEITTTQETTLYRVWGGTARQLGAWMSATPPTSSAAVRAAMALPPQNEATSWCVVTVPAGTRMRVGIAAPAFGQPGGGRQVELLQLIPATAFGPEQRLAP